VKPLTSNFAVTNYNTAPGAVYRRVKIASAHATVVMVTRTALCSSALRHGEHVCGIVGSGYERFPMVSDFVRGGLTAGDRVWCFPHGGRAEVIARLLRDQAADRDAIASGQLVVLPAHESALAAVASHPGRVIDDLYRAVDDALDDGWNGFRVVGDLGWASRGPSCPDRLLDYELEVGEVLATSPATALCQYDRYRFDAETMVALTSVHATVFGTLSLPVGDQLEIRPLVGMSGLRLIGEVDLSTRHYLQTALDTTPDEDGDLHLELSELAFIDIGGVQILLRAAERLAPGRQLVVHRPPRSLRLALDLLWEAPNLVEGD
jgi:anti-anti-sigma regulatory factor